MEAPSAHAESAHAAGQGARRLHLTVLIFTPPSFAKSQVLNKGEFEILLIRGLPIVCEKANVCSGGIREMCTETR